MATISFNCEECKVSYNKKKQSDEQHRFCFLKTGGTYPCLYEYPSRTTLNLIM